MTITNQQLQEWLTASENEHLEFKEAKNNFHFEKLVKYCAALANEGGGSIVLGVTDTRPRQVVGSQVFPELERTKAGLIERLRLRIDAGEIMHPNGRVLVFTAPSRPIGMPIAVEGAYWMRAGEDLAPMTPDMLKRIFDEGGPDFSAEICPNATLADLDADAIEDLRRRWHQKSQNAAILRMSAERLLQDTELITGKGVTYAGLILLGTHRALGQHLAQAEVIFEYRSTEAAGPANQREEFRQGFLTFYDRLWELVKLRNDMQHYQDGLVMVNVPTFHERAVREAILNAVSHRDYRQPGSVFIRQFARRIEIVSPGGFPPGITPDNILDKQSPRNRRIAETLLRCGVVERSGQGADRMFEEMIAHGKELPDYSRSDRFDVFLTLPGELRHPDLLRFLSRVDPEQVSQLDSHALLVLRDAAVGEKIPVALRPRAAELVERGFLDRSRGGKYILARRYTRKAGAVGGERPRDLAYKKLLAFLEEHRKDGCTMEQLREVTPELSRSTVKRVLDELRQDGKAHSVGVTRKARWFPGAAP
jgi:ATP-dependent DNA helicase RecG